MIQHKLAIVIPAYKDTYFDEALNSISKQTNKDFTVYIGDDASPYDLYTIVKKFEPEINIVYIRFENNLGGNDLVAQWSRCVALTQYEEWVWLFSDDDVMDKNCVSNFYKAVKDYPDENIFHFDVAVINQDNKVTLTTPFPEKLSAEDLFYKKTTKQLLSFVVEYIFKRSLYVKEGGFENFDLAWGADDATWIKFLGSEQLLTIQGSIINWRNSGSNISSSSGNKKFIKRKINAYIAYFEWVNIFFIKNGKTDRTTKLNKLKCLLDSIKDTNLKLTEKIDLALYGAKNLKAGLFNSLWAIVYLIAYYLLR